MARKYKKIPAQYQNTARKCFFCDEPGLTVTHIWPKWINSILEKSPSFYQVVNKRSGLPVGAPPVTVERKRNGDMFSQKPYLLCDSCNNDWANKFEDDVVAFAKPLVAGDFVGPLDADRLLELGRWATLIFLLADRINRDTQTIPSRDKTHFFETKDPPESWTMFLGSLDKTVVHWKKKYVQHPIALANNAEHIKLLLEHPTFDTLICTMGIGGLLFHALVCSDEDFVAGFRLSSPTQSMRRIWPPLSSNGIEWPLRHQFLDLEAETLSNALVEALVSNGGIQTL